jgi:hypothetical protein
MIVGILDIVSWFLFLFFTFCKYVAWLKIGEVATAELYP